MLNLFVQSMSGRSTASYIHDESISSNATSQSEVNTAGIKHLHDLALYRLTLLLELPHNPSRQLLELAHLEVIEIALATDHEKLKALALHELFEVVMVHDGLDGARQTVRSKKRYTES